MKALLLSVAAAATFLLATEAYAQGRGFGREPVGGRMCSTGELASCKRCCQSANFSAVCENRCERLYRNTAPPKKAKKK